MQETVPHNELSYILRDFWISQWRNPIHNYLSLESHSPLQALSKSLERLSAALVCTVLGSAELQLSCKPMDARALLCLELYQELFTISYNHATTSAHSYPPAFVAMSVLVAQLCPTLCDPVDCSLPGSSVHGILQARILEWIAIAFSRGSSWPRNLTQVSSISNCSCYVCRSKTYL